MTFYEFTRWLLACLRNEQVDWFTVSPADTNGNRHAEIGLVGSDGKMVRVEIHEQEA